MEMRNERVLHLRGYRETQGNGPHPLNPPLPTEGSGEDLAKNRAKIVYFCSSNSPEPSVGRGGWGVRAKAHEFPDTLLSGWPARRDMHVGA